MVFAWKLKLAVCLLLLCTTASALGVPSASSISKVVSDDVPFNIKKSLKQTFNSLLLEVAVEPEPVEEVGIIDSVKNLYNQFLPIGEPVFEFVSGASVGYLSSRVACHKATWRKLCCVSISWFVSLVLSVDACLRSCLMPFQYFCLCDHRSELRPVWRTTSFCKLVCTGMQIAGVSLLKAKWKLRKWEVSDSAWEASLLV